MKCPFCRETITDVYNSRTTKSGNQIWRRRRCNSCSHTFTTYESCSLSFLTVAKHGGHTEGYSRAKLYASLYNSFASLRAKQSTIDAITDTVESKILDRQQVDITTQEIAYIVLVTLKSFKTTAFLRYLSQQTDLASSSQLKKELKKY
jgi:transcriptional repressor NrdR